MPRFQIPASASALALVLAPVLGAGSAGAQLGGPSLVATAPVHETTFHRQLNLIGRSQARAESRIVAQVQGVVEAIDAPEGRPVRRGDTLVRIYTDRIRLSHEAKVAEAAQAAAEADRAQRELARVEDLYRQAVVPEHNLDVAKAEATRSRERHRQLEAERDQLALDLRNCSIRTPFSGVAVQHLVDVGEWVSPGTPVVEVVDLSVAEVTVDLPERHFGEVEIGSTVTITLADQDSAPLEGAVAGIAPRAAEATHTFPVLVSVPNPDGRLASGMLVRARLELTGTFESLAVSKDAIVRDGERTMIYVVRDGAATPVPVEIASRSGVEVAVSGPGLAVGDPVVIRGNERIFPGAPVRVADDAAIGTPGAESGSAAEGAEGTP